MNKSQLVDAMAAEAQITKVDARKALEAYVKITGQQLKMGDKIALVGFGTFSVVKKQARKGVNPSTRKAITIPAKNVVKFKAGSELNDSVK